jgi:hypothetical protein
MAMTDEELLEVAAKAAPVSTQVIRWRPESWRRHVERQGLMPLLEEPLSAAPGATSRPEGRISREDVVESFARGTELDAYVAAIVWGCGSRARNRGRMLRVFRENERVVDTIQKMVRALRDADPAKAWDVLVSEHHLNWLGIAFGTKVAYFAALSSDSRLEGPVPLIADANVGAALGTRVTKDRGAYIDYCERAWALSRDLDETRRRPDQIEYALFDEGRKAT